MTRPDWDGYFLSIARTVATRADCTRRQVGAVIVKDRRIVATGYNGAPAGGPSCLAGQCPRGRSSAAPGSSYDTGAGACIALHAEQNALLWSSRADRAGATIYITCPPCDGCARLIAGSGLERVAYPDPLTPNAWGGYQVGPVPPMDLLTAQARPSTPLRPTAPAPALNGYIGGCSLCGRQPDAAFLAAITTDVATEWYCHDDSTEDPSCYELAQHHTTLPEYQ